MKNFDFVEFYKNAECFTLTQEMIPENAEIVIGNIDLPITTRCNLRCRKCSNLIPLYESKTDFDILPLLDQLKRFLECIDLVVRVNVLGGEPFLHKDLALIIETLNNSPKVYHTVLTTNGTVTPKNERLYNALTVPKNEVRISEYSQYTTASENLIKTLDEYHINYTVKKFGGNDFLWYDYGEFDDRHRSVAFLEQQYAKCDVEWFGFLHGKLYPCPRAAHATDLGLLIDDSQNYIDFTDKSLSIEQLKEQLKPFIYENKAFPCCGYCDRGTDYSKQIPVAEQI